MDDFVALYEGAGENDPDRQLPPLMPLGMVLTDTGGGKYQLALGPTMLGDYEGAYVTTEVWQGFDEVWVQPLYVLISGRSPDGTPIRFPADDPRARPIFTVGPDSAFYSPYWQTFYVQVPAGSAPDAYRSARAILDDKALVAAPGPARLASLVRRKGVIEGIFNDRDRYPSLPAPENVGPVKLGGVGYLDGEEIEYIDLGEGGFQWDRALVVEETPLFLPMWRDAEGTLRSLEVPTIGGTGPLFSETLPRISLNRPHYGSLWRAYVVEMPPAARVFAPPQHPKVVEALQEAGVPVAEVGPTIKALAGQDLVDRRANVGRVALDGAKCFETVATLDTCTWLDSQSAIEKHLGGAAIHKTDIAITCPLISFANTAVPNP